MMSPLQVSEEGGTLAISVANPWTGRRECGRLTTARARNEARPLAARAQQPERSQTKGNQRKNQALLDRSPESRRMALRSTAAGGCATAGVFLFSYGWWGVALLAHFGNPFFPQFRSTPFLCSRYLRKKSVEEPGALTPTLLPARSLTELISAPCLGETTRTIPGSLHEKTKMSHASRGTRLGRRGGYFGYFSYGNSLAKVP